MVVAPPRADELAEGARATKGVVVELQYAAELRVGGEGRCSGGGAWHGVVGGGGVWWSFRSNMRTTIAAVMPIRRRGTGGRWLSRDKYPKGHTPQHGGGGQNQSTLS